MSQHQELEKQILVEFRDFTNKVYEFIALQNQRGVDVSSVFGTALKFCGDIIENPNELVEIIHDLPSSQSYYS